MANAVNYELIEGVARLSIDDGKANALGSPQFAELSAGLDRAQDEASAVVIAGRPGLLSGGFDLKVLRSGDNAAVSKMIDDGVRFMMQLYGHPQPVVVAATGHAVALAAFLQLAGDYRIGVDGDYSIGLNEVAIGLEIPLFGQMLAKARLSRRVHQQALLTATMYSPYQAVAAGFLDQVVAQDCVLDGALQQAHKLAELDARAFAATKYQMRNADIERVLAGLSATF